MRGIHEVFRSSTNQQLSQHLTGCQAAYSEQSGNIFHLVKVLEKSLNFMLIGAFQGCGP